MSIIKTYEKKMTPGRVKAKERGDVNIDLLVKHGAARILPPAPVYADLTDLPRSRGEAAQQLNALTRDQDPEFVSALLRMGPAQAFSYLEGLRPPATKRDEKNNANEAGSAIPSKQTSAPEPKSGSEGSGRGAPENKP